MDQHYLPLPYFVCLNPQLNLHRAHYIRKYILSILIVLINKENSLEQERKISPAAADATYRGKENRVRQRKIP